MELLKDQQGKIEGYYLKNCIVDPDFKVIGVVLGHCLFNFHGDICGKYFRGEVRDLDGCIVADTEIGTADYHGKLDSGELLKDAWEIISRIKDHSCPSVEENNDWSSISLKDLLLNAVPVHPQDTTGG